MTFKRLSCLLLIVTCFFIAGCDFLTPDDVEPDDVETPEGMVSIPGVEFQSILFQMGSVLDPDADDDERPAHLVSIDAFFMDKYEVTNAQYQKFVLANPRWGKDRIDSRFHDGDYLAHWNGNDDPGEIANHPVVFVSWYGAMAYAIWVGKRLPTEAEWECAARGSGLRSKYPWGDVIDSSKANYGFNVGDTTPVSSYPPNGYGLYDMAGNVYEWCLDEYNPNFYRTSPRENPIAGDKTVDWIINNFTDVNAIKLRVLRGGSWNVDPEFVRVANRNRVTPTLTYNGFGFRCARLLKSLPLYPFYPC